MGRTVAWKIALLGVEQRLGAENRSDLARLGHDTS